MRAARRNFYQPTHPINACPFEAVYNGSWSKVDYFTIKEGKIIIHFEEHGFKEVEKIPVDNLRLSSRKANLYDCSFLLRPGVDVCVLSSVPSKTNSSKESLQPVKVDAKITSIARKPHEHGCTCLFNVCVNEVHPQRETKELCINNIAILQELDKNPCEDGYFRWISSKDCHSRNVAKLFRRQFMHDVSWFLVASSLKKVEFEISSVKNKILYRVVADESDTVSFRDDKIVKAVNFKVNGGVLSANIATFVLDIVEETSLVEGKEEDDSSKFSPDDAMLRRSGRRNIQPERYVGDDSFSNGKSWVNYQKAKQSADHNLSSMILSVSDSNSFIDSQDSGGTSGPESNGKAISSEADVKLTWTDSHCSEFTQRDKSVRKLTSTPSHCTEGTSRNESGRKMISCMTELSDKVTCSTHLHCTEGTSRDESGRKAVTSKTDVRVNSAHSHCSKGTSRQESIRTGIPRKIKLCDAAVTTSNGRTGHKRSREDEVSFEQVQHSDHVSKQNNKRVKTSVASSSTSTPICEDTVLNQQDHLANRGEKGGTKSSKCVKSASKHRKDASGRSGKSQDVKKRFGMKISGQKFKRKLPVKSREKWPSGIWKAREKGPYGIRRTTILRNNECSKIIEECMMNINVERLKHQQSAVDQWEEIMSNQWWKLPQELPSNDVVENSELDDLWKEMEMAMHSLQFPEENQAADDGTLNKSRVDDEETCQHEYILDEQIGTICRLCSSIGTEIRHILPTFLQKPGRIYVQNGEIKSEGRSSDGDLEFNFNMFDKPATASRDASILEENASVWALIPDLQRKLHVHQKNAFEFLWRNIAGALMPADMDEALGKTGGCIISHSPGAGKTFLIISFLVSYLKLCPGKRPLILAPKTTLHTWYKEFKKWEVSVPLYLIHARKEFRREMRDKKMRGSSGRLPLNRDILHTVDCLQKFEKWHEHASVLLMSYPSFSAIMKRSSRVEHWKYMARILRKSPGLLILDEGHNPRSTDSVLRKILMYVKTEHRILLSGTLFQNNLEEYFNTLCLARPRFITDVLMKLPPNTKGVQYKKRNAQEMRARKFFLETVANSIYSKVDEERVKGLNILKNITGKFIDIYESGISDSLPGLNSCKILMRPSAMQQEYLVTLQKNITCQRFFLKLQALVTYASIHPWLIKCSPYASQCYSVKELKELAKCKMDVRMGSKVSFVVNLVTKCRIMKEKVLIFCRYKEPIKLFVEIFKKRFGWKNDEEVLILNGEQELLERSRVIDKFEEPTGSSQVLLASIAACSEGISLTAASRVVLLDSEWNPSKSKQAVARAFRPGQEKMVYVYQLLATGTLEEEKYGKNTWKESVSRMILAGSGTEDESCRRKEDVDDQVLKQIMEEDCGQLIHGIARDDKWSFEK